MQLCARYCGGSLKKTDHNQLYFCTKWSRVYNCNKTLVTLSNGDKCERVEKFHSSLSCLVSDTK